MPISPFLEDGVFDQKLIDSMSKALIGACEGLGLRGKHDAATRLLAMSIIEQAREGVHDVEQLQSAALKGRGPIISHWRRGPPN